MARRDALVLLLVVAGVALAAGDLLLGAGPKKPGQGQGGPKNQPGGGKPHNPDGKGPLVTVTCEVKATNPPYRISTCAVTSLAKDPVCVQLSCSPPPGPACIPSGAGASGPSAGRGSQNCSWVVNRDCSSPTPLFPLPPGAHSLRPQAQWGFGFITPLPGPISVSLASFTPATNGSCPKPQ